MYAVGFSAHSGVTAIIEGRLLITRDVITDSLDGHICHDRMTGPTACPPVLPLQSMASLLLFLRIETMHLLLVVSLALLPTVTVAIGDWSSNWSVERQLLSAFDVDPFDGRCTMRGSGDIFFGPDGTGHDVAIFYGSPRLYISKDAEVVEGWEDVEMTGYGKFVNDGTLKSYSGLTMAVRSNHDNYKDDGCDASGYYARIYRDTGQCAFQKEHFHGTSLDGTYSGTVYTATKRVDCFPGGLPLNQWIGMKFKVTTIPYTDDVSLELYLDENNTGEWNLKHAALDTPGSWLPSGGNTVPSECNISDGDTVTGPRNVCFFRSDGSIETEVHWRDASVINSLTPSCIPDGETEDGLPCTTSTNCCAGAGVCTGGKPSLRVCAAIAEAPSMAPPESPVSPICGDVNQPCCDGYACISELACKGNGRCK